MLVRIAYMLQVPKSGAIRQCTGIIRQLVRTRAGQVTLSIGFSRQQEGGERQRHIGQQGILGRQCRREPTSQGQDRQEMARG